MDKLDYFIERTDDRLSQIEQKLEIVIQFKGQIIFGAVIASSLFSIAFQLVIFYFKK